MSGPGGPQTSSSSYLLRAPQRMSVEKKFCNVEQFQIEIRTFAFLWGKLTFDMKKLELKMRRKKTTMRHWKLDQKEAGKGFLKIHLLCIHFFGGNI